MYLVCKGVFSYEHFFAKCLQMPECITTGDALAKLSTILIYKANCFITSSIFYFNKIPNKLLNGEEMAG